MLIPSPKVATYDLKPEMSAREVTDKLVEAMKHAAAALRDALRADTAFRPATIVAARYDLDSGLVRVLP